MKWLNDNRIQIEPPTKTKKITGTRFATILGLNPWSTDFEVWNAITKNFEIPFEDTIYTIAGKTIEPKQAEYMKTAYGMSNLKTPTDIYGKDYFKNTRGDFFSEEPILGGMWDYLLYEDGKPSTVLEMKTTKRSEDWQDDIPEYYALQAALYAYLLNIDDVIMIVSFLNEDDYENPEDFTVSIENTITKEFKVSKRYPDFKEKVNKVIAWWNEYVLTGISPKYDEKKDAEILKALRTNNLTPETNMQDIICEADTLTKEIAEIMNAISDKEKRLKKLTTIIKEYAIENFNDGDTKVTLSGINYIWNVSKTNTSSIDKEQLEKDGILDKYTVLKESYRITTSKKESK